jgi:hypothetical protein
MAYRYRYAQNHDQRMDTSKLLGIHQPCEMLETTIIGALGIFGKTTGWQLAHLQMVG